MNQISRRLALESLHAGQQLQAALLGVLDAASEGRFGLLFGVGGAIAVERFDAPGFAGAE